MPRIVYVVQVAFWVSVPLFAVYLSVSPRDNGLGWPGEALLCVVIASSVFLTVQLALPTPTREEDGEVVGSGSARYP